jgi:phosphatidylserine/phosphatidylglycerophosphate/cardiolipin synthase-like enzyme
MRSDAARRQHWSLADSRIAEKPDTAPVQVDWLIDNSAAHDALIQAVRNARESIWISQLAFDADYTAHAGDDAAPRADTDGENLLDTILATSEEHRVVVRILLNSTLLLDTRRPLLKFLAGCKRDASLVEVRGISRFPQLLHAKIVVIDGRQAFLMGSPFVNGYWDAPSHRPLDRRRPRRELGGRPVHDVSVALRGNVVPSLAAIFARLWVGAERQDASIDAPARTSSTYSEAPSTEMRLSGRKAGKRDAEVVTTEPRGVGGSGNPGSRQTLDALLDGIDRARSLIYVEHQYLSSRPVADALRAALDRQHTLEIVLLLNQNPDVTAYRRWQDARLAETGLLDHPRVGVFALWSTGPRNEAGAGINQVFVHSKVVIVDDTWAMVGSANLDGASLDSYGDDFSGRLGRRVFRNVRNFDVGVVLATGRKSGSAKNPIYQLRHRLWTEHLSHPLSEAPRSSHVADWKALASRNIAALNEAAEGRPRELEGSFVLPYSTELSPRAQLVDLGVRSSACRDLHFDPGWLELHCSPNWIRNMFL